jgi:hypothetical protein
MATQIVIDHTGLALLRSWLTVEQEGQYDSHKSFVGSNTGTRYRIRHGRMMNR